VDVLFGVRLQRHGIAAHSGRNTARLALAAELPRLGPGRPHRHRHQHSRTLVSVGQTRLDRVCRPEGSRCPSHCPSMKWPRDICGCDVRSDRPREHRQAQRAARLVGMFN
jgi:hypothetical protein